MFDLNKPPRQSLKMLVRKALKNRYGFDHVKIAKNGAVTGYYDYSQGAGTKFGNFAQFRWNRTESMNIQILSGSSVIFTFAHDV